jgi:trehalose 6-phosphate phosphatase
LRHIFADWPNILQRLSDARQILLLTDYDGTLTPIMERPDLVTTPDSLQQLLQTLADQQFLTLGIISGRALVDLKTKVNVRGAVYAGNHGIEIEGPGLSFVAPGADEIRPFFQALAMRLAMALAPIPGVFVENKGYSLSVHYRLMPVDQAYHLKNVLGNILDCAMTSEKLRVTAGKKIYEIKPEIDWDKGKAIRLLIDRYGNNENQGAILPVYLGDDVTDEDGFRAIKQFGQGITIYIGNNVCNTVADHFLRSTEEAIVFLRTLSENSQRGFIPSDQFAEQAGNIGNRYH